VEVLEDVLEQELQLLRQVDKVVEELVDGMLVLQTPEQVMVLQELLTPVVEVVVLLGVVVELEVVEVVV
jgi:hypothetical protein